MSTFLPGYVQTPFGGWVADDGTGPYFANDVFGEEVYKPLPSGFWTKTDGSGPFFYDVATGEATEVAILFRSIV